MLTLKDFIKETLSQIVVAVSEFSKEHEAIGATTNPKLQTSVKTSEWSNVGLIFSGWGEDGGANYATLVDFDIALTAEDSENSKFGGGIRVLSFLGADGERSDISKSSSVSRIKFRLPVQVRSK
ncbi:MAG: hypothetical protein KF895_15785 [Parvibaculum sp.]|nr:hypothetical protein [Parvibaculum sp.]